MDTLGGVQESLVTFHEAVGEIDLLSILAKLNSTGSTYFCKRRKFSSPFSSGLTISFLTFAMTFSILSR